MELEGPLFCSQELPPPLDPVMSHMNPVHVLISSLKIILYYPLMNAYVSKISYYLYAFGLTFCRHLLSLHTFYMFRPSHPASFDNPNAIS
jgi:hypothetical protein